MWWWVWLFPLAVGCSGAVPSLHFLHRCVSIGRGNGGETSRRTEDEKRNAANGIINEWKRETPKGGDRDKGTSVAGQTGRRRPGCKDSEGQSGRRLIQGRRRTKGRKDGENRGSDELQDAEGKGVRNRDSK